MNDQCILRIQIYRQSLHLEYFRYFAARGCPIMKYSVALAIYCLQVELAQKDAKGGLSNHVPFRVSRVRDVF